MDKEIKTHYKAISQIIEQNHPDTNWKQLIKYNNRVISYFQAERLFHLIVTLAIGYFSILSIGYTAINKSIPFSVISALLLILFVPYIFHYFHLENGVQSLYKIDKQLQEKVSTN